MFNPFTSWSKTDSSLRGWISGISSGVSSPACSESSGLSGLDGSPTGCSESSGLSGLDGSPTGSSCCDSGGTAKESRFRVVPFKMESCFSWNSWGFTKASWTLGQPNMVRITGEKSIGRVWSWSGCTSISFPFKPPSPLSEAAGWSPLAARASANFCLGGIAVGRR